MGIFHIQCGFHQLDTEHLTLCDCHADIRYTARFNHRKRCHEWYRRNFRTGINGLDPGRIFCRPTTME